MSAWTCHQSEGKAAQKIVPPRLRTPCWKGPGADSEEKREPASDINIGAVDSLKALDPERPIREADINYRERYVGFDVRRTISLAIRKARMNGHLCSTTMWSKKFNLPARGLRSPAQKVYIL